MQKTRDKLIELQ